jgi:integrase/recombinase XerD
VVRIHVGEPNLLKSMIWRDDLTPCTRLLYTGGMSLILFRRHINACRVHKTKLPARAKRLFMDCECPIWMYGRTDDGLVPRQSTGYTTLPEAEALRASLVARSQTEVVRGPRLSDCIVKYLASRRHELSEMTYGHHQLLLSRLKTYCERQGVYFARELTVDLLETFKCDGLPNLADTSKSTAVAKLRCFLRDAFRRGWITESLVDRVKSHRAVYEQKEPYSDEEVERILDEALKLSGGTRGYAKQPKTFRLLLELMLETGMRVGDAVRFNPILVTKGEHLWIYTYLPQKHKRTERPRAVEAYLSDRLKRAIDACDWLSPKLPFVFGSSTNPAHLANEVYERMKALGARCGVADCRPHRLRDTFAVRKLLAGLQLEDVSRLLAHSSVKVTETYYAKWVASRKLRLERLVAESLMNAERDALGNR